MGEPILALSFAEQANEVLPEQSPILHQLGGLYRKLGNHSKAEEFLLQAQKLDPQNPIITKTLAFLRSDQERFAEQKIWL
jgi:Flp pilus assembly protein TadD